MELGNKTYTVEHNIGHKTASELIIATSELIGEPLGKMFGLTQCWSTEKLDRMYRDAKKDDNPTIRWWTMRKIEK